MTMFFIFAHVIATAAPYENLSREELLVTVVIVKLQHELEQLKRIIFNSSLW